MSFIIAAMSDPKLIAFGKRNPDFMQLGMMLNEEAGNNLLATYRANPALLTSLEQIKAENPSLANDLALTYKTSPQAFDTMIARISKEPDAVISDLKRNKERQAGPQARSMSEEPQGPQQTTENGATSQTLQTGDTAPGSENPAGTATQATTSPAATTSTPGSSAAAPSASNGKEAGGIDMNNLGAGLQEMFSNLMTFFEALPKIIEAFSGMLSQAFSGLKGGNLFAAGNNGPGKDLVSALGGKPENVTYQYGDAEPKVGMVGFDPAQPGVYRDQQTRMPTDPMLDRALNPSLRPGEAVS